MTAGIAIVGMACQYPDARSPRELWENVLAQRRAFRRLPAERLDPADYYSPDRNAPDCTYAAEAAVIEGYEFDRLRFRVVGSTFRSADLAHWLALDIASAALDDAGFGDGQGLPRDTTGVLLGNTLTGEFSRANVMRLRWPYVRRVLEAALEKQDWSQERRRPFLDELEASYKAPFPPVGEETLSGGLSNTIAGRICNHFDLHGGGYTVDGACAASLLAVANACSALVAGDLDVALAGGVDLSLDPFELVGFAKTGALAPDEMRVYDTRSAGFWPGEGCGFVVLMRHDDAVAQRRRIYATIRGWGISSDGNGGITRPDVDGQLLALQRAYRRAGFGADTVAYFEGHGTGTNVGDATELRVVSRARRDANDTAAPAVIGSIKANIGHTKAAAGIAGLIKATMAVHSQILPPTTGCSQPHGELTGPSPALRTLSAGEPWPADQALRAAVSAMGFGGINTHVVLDGASPARRSATSRERDLLRSAQDCELFLLNAHDRGDLQRQVEQLLGYAAALSRSELADLAVCLQQKLDGRSVRAAVIAATPRELAERLEILRSALADSLTELVDVDAGVFLGERTVLARIGFLFPGQGSPSHRDGGIWRRRFAAVDDLYSKLDLPDVADATHTAVAQPAIVAASLAALRVLRELGLDAAVGVGHSLGELTAYCWAGAFDEVAALRTARVRGRAMADLGSPTGTMVSIAAAAADVSTLLNGQSLVIAGLNAPRQTVVSGEAAAAEALLAAARNRGWRAMRLPVSHAFHSPLVSAAAVPLFEHLAHEQVGPLRKPVRSTIAGALLAEEADVRALLREQVTSPVRFVEAIGGAAGEVDLWIEVGPGQVLTGLLADFGQSAIPIDAGGPSLRGLLNAAAAAFALGVPIQHEALFTGRFSRPFDLNWRPQFFVNPCETAPRGEYRRSPDLQDSPVTRSAEPPRAGLETCGTPTAQAALEVVRQLVARRAELPASAIRDEHRLLSDLHLNSITVGQLVAEAARALSLPAPAALTDYADATVAAAATALEQLRSTGAARIATEHRGQPEGVDSWIRAFTIDWVEQPLPPSVAANQASAAVDPSWQVLCAPQHPLGDPLRREFVGLSGGRGMVVGLLPDADEQQVELLLEGAQTALRDHAAHADTPFTFVLVQDGRGGGAFARTLKLECPGLTTCVVDVPFDAPNAANCIAAEALAARDYTEVRYDLAGRRSVPVLKLLPIDKALGEPLGRDDMLLVTGGGKGIAAECALALAKRSGARLAIIGRSDPETDAELATNLRRVSSNGVRFHYAMADVCDADAVRQAVADVQAHLGAVTAILHGAGTNVPQLIASLDASAIQRTLAPKLDGLRNLLAAVDPQRLRLLVSFGSIIARTGLPGEADYALANDWLSDLTEQWQHDHPQCRCLCIEWSVWSGVGMGERLGRIDALRAQGVTPIPIDEGVRWLTDLVAQPSTPVRVVVTGRFGLPPTLRMPETELPLLRFVGKPRAFYPGVELVTDVPLSADADPYLADHMFRGEKLFPAVLGLEAMAQVAVALRGTSELPSFEKVKFHRPVAVSAAGLGTLRLAALVRDDERIDVVLRCDSTDFAADHFSATCRWGHTNAERMAALRMAMPPVPPLPLDPERDMYGGILFHAGRFRRLRNYRKLTATECIAEIACDQATAWFGAYQPATLLLGDPAIRDAAIHAIQACIPHATVLPIGVERITLYAATTASSVFVHARERSRQGDEFIYDMELVDPDGRVIERWAGLTLRAVERRTTKRAWPPALLGPYLERRLGELAAHSLVRVAIENGQGERRERTERAMRHIGEHSDLAYRPDGKPESSNGRAVSAAHAGQLTMAVAGPPPLGCDLEPVVSRTAETWRDLLGAERSALAQAISREAREDADCAATRAWTACEALKKAGAALDVPLALRSASPDGWVLLSAGKLTVATLVTAADVGSASDPDSLALGVVLGNGDARV